MRIPPADFCLSSPALDILPFRRQQTRHVRPCPLRQSAAAVDHGRAGVGDVLATNSDPPAAATSVAQRMEAGLMQVYAWAAWPSRKLESRVRIPFRALLLLFLPSAPAVIPRRGWIRVGLFELPSIAEELAHGEIASGCLCCGDDNFTGPPGANTRRPRRGLRVETIREDSSWKIIPRSGDPSTDRPTAAPHPRRHYHRLRLPPLEVPKSANKSLRIAAGGSGEDKGVAVGVPRSPLNSATASVVPLVLTDPAGANQRHKTP